jgi:Secretion system C-terminal sorting domain
LFKFFNLLLKMKKSLYLLLLLCNVAHAQFTNFTKVLRSHHQTSISAGQVVPDAQGVTMLVNNDERQVVYRFNPTGEVEFVYQWNGFTTAAQLQRKGSNTYIMSSDVDCDVLLGSFFRCVDSTGTVLWAYQPESDMLPEKLHFIPCGNQHWWVWNETTQPRLIDDATGLAVDTLPVLRPAIRDYRVLPDDQTLAYTESGLLRYNADFELTGTALSGRNVEALCQSGDHLLAYGEGRLWLLSSALDVLAETNIAPLIGYGTIQLSVQGDQLFVSRIGDAPTRWFEFDLSLNVVAQGDYPDQGALDPIGFARYGDHWLVAGTNLDYLPVLKCVEAPYPGYQHQMDVAIETITATDSVQVGLDYAPSSYVAVTFRIDSLLVTVKNNSPVPIDKFRITQSQGGWFMFCNTNGEISYTFNETLAAGATATVLIEDIGWSKSGLISELNNLLLPKPLFLFSDLPQDSLDINAANNLKGITVPVEAVVGTQTQFAPDALQIWPNPAHETLMVTVPNTEFDVEIYDGMGRLVANAAGQSGTYQWQCADLPAGMYQVRVRAGERVGVVKVVVE